MFVVSPTLMAYGSRSQRVVADTETTAGDVSVVPTGATSLGLDPVGPVRAIEARIANRDTIESSGGGAGATSSVITGAPAARLNRSALVFAAPTEN